MNSTCVLNIINMFIMENKNYIFKWKYNIAFFIIDTLVTTIL